MYTSETTVRPATFDDVDTLALLAERAVAARFEEPLPEALNGPVTAARVKKRLEKPGAWAFLAEQANGPAGFVLGHSSCDEWSLVDIHVAKPGLEYLSLLMIEPEVWGRRIGSTLLQQAAMHARHHDKEAMTLWTGEANHRAQRLYERSGYVLTGQKDHYQSETLVRYELDLQPPLHNID